MNNKIIKKCIAMLLIIITICFAQVTNVQAIRNYYIRIKINIRQYKISYSTIYYSTYKKQTIQTKDTNSIENKNTIDDYNFKDIIYYCNTSLKESLKIDDTIKQKAYNLTKDISLDYKKAYILFEFISKHIFYDYERYNIIKSRGNMCNWEAGALHAYYNRKGVCFEYATLFAAMANYIGLQVRLIYGENHIWNQFYNRQTNTWVTVDATWKKFNFDVNQYHKVYAIQAEF